VNRRKFVELAAIAPLAGTSLQHDDAAPAKPLVMLPDQARVYDTGRGETRILVGGKQSAGGWWLGSFVSEPGRKTSLHVHFSAEEQFYVVEGVLSAWIDGKWLDLPAGSVATAPRKVPHALGNRSKQPVKFLVAGEPAGFEHFFPDIEKLAKQFTYGSPEFLAELAKVYKKYDSELLGPPPQG
jgi:quercetin dioxygenase-like cupin family protein